MRTPRALELTVATGLALLASTGAARGEDDGLPPPSIVRPARPSLDSLEVAVSDPTTGRKSSYSVDARGHYKARVTGGDRPDETITGDATPEELAALRSAYASASLPPALATPAANAPVVSLTAKSGDGTTSLSGAAPTTGPEAEALEKVLAPLQRIASRVRTAQRSSAPAAGSRAADEPASSGRQAGLATHLDGSYGAPVTRPRETPARVAHDDDSWRAPHLPGGLEPGLEKSITDEARRELGSPSRPAARPARITAGGRPVQIVAWRDTPSGVSCTTRYVDADGHFTDEPEVRRDGADLSVPDRFPLGTRTRVLVGNDVRDAQLVDWRAGPNGGEYLVRPGRVDAKTRQWVADASPEDAWRTARDLQLEELEARYVSAVGPHVAGKTSCAGHGAVNNTVQFFQALPGLVHGEFDTPTGCRECQFETFNCLREAIQQLGPSADWDVKRVATFYPGTTSCRHRAVVVFPKGGSPSDGMVFDPWPEQTTDGSISSWSEWCSVHGEGHPITKDD